jgi:hypothetical protein
MAAQPGTRKVGGRLLHCDRALGEPRAAPGVKATGEEEDQGDACPQHSADADPPPPRHLPATTSASSSTQPSRVITLWETAEAELAARNARGAMRDQLMAIAGLEVASFDVYEVPGHEFLDP